jgi:hypothetical protein
MDGELEPRRELRLSNQAAALEEIPGQELEEERRGGRRHPQPRPSTGAPPRPTAVGPCSLPPTAVVRGAPPRPTTAGPCSIARPCSAARLAVGRARGTPPASPTAGVEGSFAPASTRGGRGSPRARPCGLWHHGICRLCNTGPLKNRGESCLKPAKTQNAKTNLGPNAKHTHSTIYAAVAPTAHRSGPAKRPLERGLPRSRAHAASSEVRLARGLTPPRAKSASL